MLGLQAPCYATACRGTPREGIGHSDHSERLRPADSAAAAPHPARVLVIPRLRGLRSGVSYFLTLVLVRTAVVLYSCTYM